MPAAELRDKYERLSEILRELGGVVIGYSGGVDSTLLVKVARDVLGDGALAVIGRSATYPSREYEEAVRVALELDVRWIEVTTEETDVLKFREGDPVDCRRGDHRRYARFPAGEEGGKRTERPLPPA